MSPISRLVGILGASFIFFVNHQNSFCRFKIGSIRSNSHVPEIIAVIRAHFEQFASALSVNFF